MLSCLLLVSVGGASAAAALVAGPNADPVAKDNSYRVHKDSILKKSAPGVLNNDSDPDGDKLSATRASSPRHGKLVLRSGGGFVYTPDKGYHGMDSFTYTARDGNGGTDTATVEITVWPVTTPPLARNDVYRMVEDGILTKSAPGVLRNDAEADGRRLFATKVTDPAHGSLILNRDGSFVYTPEPDFNGEDSFIYRAADRTGRGDKATVTFTVDAVNDLPAFTGAAGNTSQTIDEGSGLAALEATDVDGDTLTFEPMNGSMPEGITLDSDGTFSGTAGGRAAGSYTEEIKVSDGNGGSATTTLETTVNQIDVSPDADGLSVDTNEDTAKTLTLSATDTDSDNLTFSTSLPGHGTLGTMSAPNCVTTAGTATCTATVEYTPEADYYGPDSFTYTANDTNSDSDDATVNITVNAVNDAPVASDDTKSTPENTPLVFSASDLLANDSKGATNEDDQTLSVTEVENAQRGTVSLDSGGQITFNPDADYNGPASFEYTVRDDGQTNGVDDFKSDTSTVEVSVSPVNSKPTASATPSGLDIDEDAAAQTITLSGSDVETVAANLLFTITKAPAHGVLKKDTTVLSNDETFTGSPTDVTYEPDADYNGSDPFEFKVTDRGDPDNCGAPGPACDAAKDSDTQTVPITVNPINDAPSFDLGSDQTVENTAGAQTVSGFATNILAGPPNESGQTLTFDVTNDDNSLFSVQPDIDEASGDLTYTPNENASGTATVTVTLKDDRGTANGGQDTTTKTFKITVKPPNAPPVAASQSVSADEDVAKTITLAADDPDGDAVTSFSISDPPDHGTLDSIEPITCNAQTPNHCTADVSYTPNADYNGADQFEFTASDAEETSSAATVSITVNAVNDVAVLANIESGALAYTENDPATIVTSTTTVSDVDSANFDTGTLTVDYTAGGTADDRLEIRNEGTGAGQIGVSGSNVTYEGTTIGSFSGGTGTTPLVVTLNSDATSAATQALVRNITYRNVSDNPSIATRTVRFVLADGDGGTSAPVNRNVSVTAVNDPPALAAIESGALGYTENDPATSVTSALTVTDPDSNITGATVTIGTNLAPSEDVLSFANQLGITGTYNAATGVLTLTGSASPADYQTALRAVKYSNSSEDPSTLTRNVSFQVKDGPPAANLSNTQSRDVTVTAVNDAPVADNETFNGTNSAVGNTTLVGNDPDDGAPATPDPTDTSPVTDRPHKTISGDILAGDTDVDGPGPLTVSAGTFPTNDGGTVTIQSDGDFTFEPSPSTSCIDTSDSFDYTINDGGSPNQTGTGSVTIAISGCAWYVNNDDAQGNSGTSEKPFDTLAQAETASGSNHSIFVYDGNDTTSGYNSGINLKSGQKLIGEAATLTVGSDNLHSADANNRPTITDNNDDVVALDDANEVRGVELDPQGTGGGIAGATGDTGGGTIDDVRIIDTGTAGTQPGLELDSTTGTFNVSRLTINNTAATGQTGGSIGVRLNNAGTVNFSSTVQNSINVTGAKGLDVLGTNMGTSTFHGIIVSNSGTGGVRIGSSASPVTGTTTLGDGAGTDLALTTTSGSEPALALNSAGTVTVPSSGGADLHATGGPAADVTGTNATLNLDTVDSTNSSGDGVNLDFTGTGNTGSDFSATSGTIGGAAGISFDLNGGDANSTVSYPGTLNNGAGTTAVDITGRSGGTVTLSGPINDTNDAGGGINVASNTGGSTEFSNATKTLNTGASAALLFNNSDGHTLTLSGGGLDIDTAAGKGLEADTSGTLNVTGTGNTIDTGTGTALRVSNTDIGASDLTFQNVSANGATNGIVLNNTGTSGNLSVTGNTGVCTIAAQTCSGGTIQSTAGDGISLTNTSSPSFNLVRILNTGGHGISGTTTSGLSLSNSLVQGAGDADNEAGLFFANVNGTNLTGSSSITNTVVNAPADVGAFIQNYGGTLNLTVSGSTFSGTQRNTPGVVTGDDLMRLVADGTPATITASFTGNTFDRSESDGIAAFAVSSTGSGGGTLNLTADGNTFTGDNGGSTCPNGCNDNAIVAQATSDGTMKFTIQNNNVQNQRNEAIATRSDNTSDVQGTIKNNTIGTAATPGSGSLFAQGIFMASDDNSDFVARVENNAIHSTFFQGISASTTDGAGGSPKMDLTILGNTTPTPAETGGTYLPSIEMTASGNASACTRTENNTAQAGSGGAGSIDFLLFRDTATSTATFKLEGLTTPTADARVFVKSKNPASADPVFAFAAKDSSNTSTPQFTGGTCRTPAVTPTP